MSKLEGKKKKKTRAHLVHPVLCPSPFCVVFRPSSWCHLCPRGVTLCPGCIVSPFGCPRPWPCHLDAWWMKGGGGGLQRKLEQPALQVDV